ncbi:MAG: chromosome segregation protein SMC, partial [Lachnospiraceae bacterium]|nr:chromosome segregation protein SMC [Lachnospiraceae bacterium]
MYLKSIEVQGFKSFAHKTTFEFHNGITAIVGPNGSGKSNVADAVRWVFGEQSAKQLRGSNMQDIIFAGTQTRRPQSFASVSLTLDNSDHSLDLDYAEVTVTRKVYRSGESEYLINNNNCRLKDILELFYDTGIGKEGYSIIGQGQVDKIISGKMDERRELFDEACGIVKFKKRKTAAVRKLEKEQTDMLRISDLVSELERQAGPLKRQSETAREYLRLRDELRAYDINAFLIDYNRYREQLEETARNLSDTEKELEEKKAEEQTLRERYASLEETLSELETDLEELRRLVNEATEEKTSLEGKISVVKEKIRADETQAEHYKDRIRAIETEIREKEQEIEDLKAGSLKNQEEAAELKKAYNELQRKLQEQRTRISLYKKTAEENQQGLMDLLAEKDETTSRLSALNTLLSQETLRLQETEEQLKSVNKTIEEAEEKLKTLSGDEKDAESSLSSKKDELAELQRELDEADLSYEALRQEINDNNQKFQINRSRYETLRAVQEQYEGFNNAVRRVMEVRSRYPGICGVVSDLIRVDKKFRTAIEAALGGNYQNIVTEDQKTARDLISFLKESRSGRATFLPLDAVRPIGRLSDERILKEPGVYGTANTLTEADKRYDNVVRNLLERIVVVEDLKTASDLARKYRYQIRMVTLEGDILAVGGSMTGGSFKNNNHYLGRTEELEALSRTNERLKSETAEKEKELNLKKQLKESLQVETDDLREEI